MRAAIYCRVSHPSQVKKGQSLPNQESVLRERARNVGAGEMDVYIEAGISGKNDERPEYNRLLAAVIEGRYDALFVYDITRLTRTPSREEQGRIIKILANAGCDLYTESSHYDLNNPESRFLFGIGAEVALYDNSLRAQKVQSGRKDAREDGKNPGQAPATGYFKEYRKDGTLLYKMDPAAIAPVKLAFDMALAGAGAVKIRRALAEQGFKSGTGNPYTLAHVYQWLKNPTYAGYVHVGYARGSKAKEKGMWPAKFLEGSIVTLEEWERVQILLENRKVRRSLERYPLSGILRCPSCGERMSGQYKGGWKEGGPVRYYSCIPTGTELERFCPNTQGRSIKMTIAHQLLLESLGEIIDHLGFNYDAILEEAALKAHSGMGDVDPKNLQKELKAVERKIMHNIQENENEPSEYYRKRIRTLKEEAERIKRLIHESQRQTHLSIPDLRILKDAVKHLDPSDNHLLDELGKQLFTKIHYKRTGTHRKYTFQLTSVEFTWGGTLRFKRVSSYSQ